MSAEGAIHPGQQSGWWGEEEEGTAETGERAGKFEFRMDLSFKMSNCELKDALLWF